MKPYHLCVALVLLALPACSSIEASFPAQSEKAIDLTKKGLSFYCKKVAPEDRKRLREKINTDQQGAYVWCTEEERPLLYPGT